jgi:hypothetical protein
VGAGRWAGTVLHVLVASDLSLAFPGLLASEGGQALALRMTFASVAAQAGCTITPVIGISALLAQAGTHYAEAEQAIAGSFGTMTR